MSPPDPLPGGEHPSAAEAESMLKEVAGTYASDLETLQSTGAIHHFSPSAPGNDGAESPLPNLDAKC